MLMNALQIVGPRSMKRIKIPVPQLPEAEEVSGVGMKKADRQEPRRRDLSGEQDSRPRPRNRVGQRSEMDRQHGQHRHQHDDGQSVEHQAVQPVGRRSEPVPGGGFCRPAGQQAVQGAVPEDRDQDR